MKPRTHKIPPPYKLPPSLTSRARMPKASKPAAPPPHTQSTLLAIYEWALDQDNADLVGCMQRQGVKVPNDDHSLQLRQDLYNLKHLEDKQQEPGGAAVLEQAVGWLDGLMREAGLEADQTLTGIKLEMRTHCVLRHITPPHQLGKAAAKNGKKALEKQFPERDSEGGSKSRAASVRPYIHLSHSCLLCSAVDCGSVRVRRSGTSCWTRRSWTATTRTTRR